MQSHDNYITMCCKGLTWWELISLDTRLALFYYSGRNRLRETLDGDSTGKSVGLYRGVVMEDLGLVAGLFKTSSILESAATALEKLAASKKEEISSAEKHGLSWSGEFLSAMDWNAQQPPKPVAGGLALQATSVRPTFYSCLFRMAPKLRDAGMHDQRQLRSFLSKLYTTLVSSGGGRGPKKQKLTADQSRLGALLLHEMAESILVQINNNGLPQPTATLKDEWKPTSNEITPVFAGR
jgi:hypothetical protein